MPQSDALRNFLASNPTKDFRILAARGVFPLPADEILLLLVYLLDDPDTDVSGEASRTLQEWPEVEVLEQLNAPSCDPGVLAYFVLARASETLRLAIVHNPNTPGRVIADLASQVSASLLEIILDNQVRILQSPEILESAKQNPNLTAGVRGRIQEIESEFFSGKKGEYRVETPSEEPAGMDEALEEAPELPIEDLSLEGLPVDPEAREQAILERLAKMSVRQKINLAMMGTREERGILIRDSNKEVSRSVLKSPKLMENEIEAFAAMRNISEEILREIGNNKGWTKRYTIAQNLVRNPRTPTAISQRLVAQLHRRDLFLLSRDRGVPDPIRRIAQRTLVQRSGPG